MLGMAMMGFIFERLGGDGVGCLLEVISMGWNVELWEVERYFRSDAQNVNTGARGDVSQGVMLNDPPAPVG